jgi:hypothetical protein
MDFETALAKIQEALGRILIEMDCLAHQIHAMMFRLKSEWWKERYQQAAALFATVSLLAATLGLWITTHAH